MIIQILFTVLALGLMAFLAWYPSWRISKTYNIKKRRLLIAFSSVIVLNMMSMTMLTRSSSPIASIFVVLSGIFFAFVVFTALGLMLGDLIHLVLKIDRRRSVVIVLVVVTLITLYGAWNAENFEIKMDTVPIIGLKEEINFVHLSDIHIGHQRGQSWLRKIIEETNRLNPDFVVINGDLIDSNIAVNPETMDLLKTFAAPVYYTNGNHEQYIDYSKITDKLKSLGIKILENEAVQIKGLQLIGLTYMNADDTRFDMHRVNDLTIKEELPKIKTDPTLPKILLHHSPVGVQYVEAAGVQLMISGHTHAGQMWPATWLSPIFSPYNRGIYKYKEMTVLVSQGAGTYGPRIRFGSNNEINHIRLIKK